VDNPGRTMLLVMLVLLPVVVAVNSLPLVAGLAKDSNYRNFQTGYFGVLASRYASWLGIWMTVGVQV